MTKTFQAVQVNELVQSSKKFNKTETALITKTMMRGASAEQVALFIATCERTGLDPFSRQIYSIQRGGKWSTQTSIDGFRVIAERSGRYEGQSTMMWCGADGVWKDVWLDSKPPAAAKVGVYKQGHREATVAVARWSSYSQNSPLWKKMGELMLSKCAEALALRKAFPNELSGLYTGDEMGQVDPVKEVKEVKEAKEVKEVKEVPVARQTKHKQKDDGSEEAPPPSQKAKKGTYSKGMDGEKMGVLAGCIGQSKSVKDLKEVWAAVTEEDLCETTLDHLKQLYIEQLKFIRGK